MGLYWNEKGKYQEILDRVSERVPGSGPSSDLAVEALRVAQNAYYDYFNNGGANRCRFADLRPLKLKRGSEASKALSKLKRYAPAKGARNVWGSYLPDGMDNLFDLMMDGVIEVYFPEEIEGAK